MQNAQTHRDVRVRAEQDALTGLRNHGAFQRELGAAVEAGRPFAVLMLDLDMFKRFNDTLGHPAGDGLLVEIAKTMTRATRDTGSPLPLRRRRVRGDPARRRSGRRPRGCRADPARRPGAHRRRERHSRSAPERHDQRRRRLLPGGRSLEGRSGGGRGPRAVPGEARRARTADAVDADPYLRALDETALALLDRTDHGRPARSDRRPSDRSSLGTPHACVDLIEPESRSTRPPRRHRASSRAILGSHIDIDEGIGWRGRSRTGQPARRSRTTTRWAGRPANPPIGARRDRRRAAPVGRQGRRGAGSGGRVTRRGAGRDRDIEALTSFAKLASIGARQRPTRRCRPARRPLRPDDRAARIASC